MSIARRRRTKIGWWTLIAMLGAMSVASASDIKELMHWGQATEPAFVATMMLHFGAVVGAFYGGKQMP